MSETVPVVFSAMALILGMGIMILLIGFVKE